MFKIMLLFFGSIYGVFIFWLAQDLTFSYFKVEDSEDYYLMQKILLFVTATSYLAGICVATMFQLH